MQVCWVHVGVAAICFMWLHVRNPSELNVSLASVGNELRLEYTSNESNLVDSYWVLMKVGLWSRLGF
jgi:hypothetical protein